ncbi:MAG: AMP-binding protein [Geminicoccaceae bacterium]
MATWGGGATVLQTLADLIDGLEREAEAPAIIAAESKTWSRGQLRRHVRDLAAGLAASGVRPGDVVGLLAPSQPEWIVALLAIVRSGALAMPLSEQMGDAELERVVEHSGARRLFTTAPFAARTPALGGVGDLILLDDEVPSGLERDDVRSWRALVRDDGKRLPEVSADQLALLLYTSGTTGTPKGVPLSHGNICANLRALEAARLARPDDRVLLPLPLHHAYPLTVGLLAPLAIGAAVVLPAGITGPQIMRALREHGCTIMIAVPRLYEAMLAGIERQIAGAPRPLGGAVRGLLRFAVWVRRRLGRRIGKALFFPLHRRIGPALRLLASGGARLDPEVAWPLEGLGWQVLTGYGLTETAPILTFNPPGRARIESAGLPVEGVELRLGPAEDTAPGHGEILAKGPNVFAGYWDNPEATAAAFTEDGFFRTGDLGYRDDAGYLHIAGRSKELIILSGGENVFPEEVEGVYGAGEQVREVAVLEHKDRLVALFVPEPDALRGRSREDLRRHFRSEVERLSPKLPSYARIGDFAITAQPLPRTQIGKLRRHELPEIFAQEKSGEGRPEPEPAATGAERALLETPPADRIWPWLEERFEGHTLTLGTSPQLDLGLDSFDWMSLTMELEEQFGIRLSEDAIARVSSLRDLLEEALQASRSTPAGELGQPTPEEERLLEPRGPTQRIFARGLLTLNRWLFRAAFRVRVEGLEHLPREGPYLMTPNHESYLDPFAIGAVIPWPQLQDLHWAGWVGLLFRGPLTRLFSRIFQVLPVDPEHGLTSTLTLGRAVLERGAPLVWFPEGQRSIDGRLHGFLPGIGLLLERTGVPAVPVWIEGTFEAWPPGRRLPQPHPVSIRIGRPITFADLDPDGDEEDRYRRVAERLRGVVAGLESQAPPPSSLGA